MKILMVNYEYPPLGGGGGIAMMEVAEELARRHSVHVLTSGAAGLDAVSKHPSLDLTIHRAAIAGRKDRATASFLSMLAFLPSGIRTGNKLLKSAQFDLINTWFAIPSGVTGGWIAKKSGVPHVLTVIGGDIYDPSKWYSPHRFPISGRAVQWAVDRADTYVAISTDIADRSRKHFRFDGNIEVIPLGIRRPEFAPATRQELGMDPGRKYIVSVGRLVRRKDYPTLIRALKALGNSDTDLVMLGDGPEQANLKALTHELGIADRVHFRGFVSNELKYQVLSMSDIFVLASLHEGFGVVYLEAMFCGLPIIAANQGGQVDILKRNVTGDLINIGSVEEMTAAIRRLLDESDLRRRIGSDNRARAEQYTIAQVTARYENVFNKLVAKDLPSLGHSTV
ncbi:MAG TPA: glycosyltransferase family 4 protein [Woeseiaceae bacterium]|nr:glycosyltransferase family 4 protein [Woeseiaceae bacterium]